MTTGLVEELRSAMVDLAQSPTALAHLRAVRLFTRAQVSSDLLKAELVQALQAAGCQIFQRTAGSTPLHEVEIPFMLGAVRGTVNVTNHNGFVLVSCTSDPGMDSLFELGIFEEAT